MLWASQIWMSGSSPKLGCFQTNFFKSVFYLFLSSPSGRPTMCVLSAGLPVLSRKFLFTFWLCSNGLSSLPPPSASFSLGWFSLHFCSLQLGDSCLVLHFRSPWSSWFWDLLVDRYFELLIRNIIHPHFIKDFSPEVLNLFFFSRTT